MDFAKAAASLALSCFLAAPALHAQDGEGEAPSGPRPLFESHDLLHLTLRADFDQLEDDRDEESEERPAVLVVAGSDGQPVEIDLQVRTRGKFRLQKRTCAFPNLRLNLKKKQAEGTVFEGQDKLKLVGHCRDRDDYEQNVLEEYLVYRSYNMVTDVSFRVRLARITYEDVNGKKDTTTRYGFVIEDDDALAERLGGTLIDVSAVPPLALDGQAAATMSVFQYMVGNTDWSMVQFHNMEIVRLPDGSHVPIPYDFDWAGTVDAPYANPDASLGTRDVKERVYRGFCRSDVDMAPIYAFFNDKREAFAELYRTQEGLEKKNADRTIRYFEDFYDTINSERRARTYIERACRDPATGR